MQQTPEQFIAEESANHAQWLVQELRKELKRRKISISDDLFNSIISNSLPAGVDLSFLTYGRMRDMGAGRGYTKGKAKYRIEEVKAKTIRKGRKKSPFYSKIAYGGLSRYIRRLQTCYTGFITETVKQMED